MSDIPFNIFALAPPQFEREHQEQLWSFHRPEVTALLRTLEAREDWICQVDREELDRLLTELVVSLNNADQLQAEHLEQVVHCLSRYRARECIYALAWLDGRGARSREILVWAQRHRESSPEASILMQRVERLAKHHVLAELVAELTRDRG